MFSKMSHPQTSFNPTPIHSHVLSYTSQSDLILQTHKSEIQHDLSTAQMLNKTAVFINATLDAQNIDSPILHQIADDLSKEAQSLQAEIEIKTNNLKKSEEIKSYYETEINLPKYPNLDPNSPHITVSLDPDLDI